MGAINLAMTLRKAGHKPEAKEFLRARSHVANRILGREDLVSLRIRWLYANSLWGDPDATLDDLVEAEATLKSVERSWRRIIGSAHQDTRDLELSLARAREKLAARQTLSGSA